MTPHVSISFEHMIWRTEINQLHHLMAVETRDESGIPYFSVIDYKKGIILLQEQTYGDRWWSMVAVTEKVLLLTCFPDPSQPTTKALIALSHPNGATIWEKYNAVFDCLTADGIAVKLPINPNEFVSILNENTGNIEGKMKRSSTLIPLHRNIHFPVALSEIPDLISKRHPEIAFVQHISWHEKQYYSIQISSEESIELRLIITFDNKILFDQVINNNFTQLLPETFFILDEQLFYITNNNHRIISYKI